MYNMFTCTNRILSFHKSDHSFDYFNVPISITHCQYHFVRFIFYFGFYRIKCFVCNNANNIKNALSSVFGDYHQNYFKKCLPIFLSYADTLYKSNVTEYSQQENYTIDVHDIFVQTNFRIILHNVR